VVRHLSHHAVPARTALVAAFVVVAATLLALAPTARAGELRAGAGRADITPPTGFYMMGWVRSDAIMKGQNTRLFARVIVLERDGKKVALVAEDLNGIPGGMVADAAKLVADIGFSESNVIVSASHTHASPVGFYNFSTYNSVAPTITTPTDFRLVDATDRQLYTFMVQRLATAIRRANDDLAPAVAGWASTKLLGLTKNRSLEAHLADHGILREFGQGKVSDDPLGYQHTIDPDVQVLRVDKVISGKRVPIGMWSSFADHGTVNKATFTYLNADHHGSATRVVEARLRALRPRGSRQEVVNAYGNTDEGDISAGLDKGGPAYADYVGRREADAMLLAWRVAGENMTSTPPLDLRWTRFCFCGQQTEGGPVADTPELGLPQTTGSEEGRGPLFDLTKTPFEGVRSPVEDGPQGHKVRGLPGSDLPKAVPIVAARIGDHVVVTVPGEITAEMGRRVRQSVLNATAGSGVRAVQLSGLANEYLSYFTTPEEYDRQHYEGGSTIFGQTSSNLLRDQLVGLAGRLVRGAPAPDPYALDPTNGLKPDGRQYPLGAEKGTAVTQPVAVRRLQRAAFAWQGGERGYDRPLDRAFVRVQRRIGSKFRTVDTDLGLAMLWEVDDAGRYTARWEVPRSQPAGVYRFLITAKRYTLASAPFKVSASRALTVVSVRRTGEGAVVELRYPQATENVDLTYRPPTASGGSVRALVGSETVNVSARKGATLTIPAPAGVPVVLAKGAVRDRDGNRSANALTVGGGR
jgi:neutral ceramidase